MTFQNFCGNSTFWGDDIFTSDRPKFPDCFITIIPAFVPTAWLIVTFPFYVISTRNCLTSPIAIRTINVSKTGICVVLALLSLFDLYVNNRHGYRCDSSTDIPTSFIVSSVCLIVSYIYVAIATQINRKKGVITSWVLWIFWVFVLICGILPLQYNILNKPKCVGSILNYISLGLSLVQVLLYSLAEKPSAYGYQRIGKPICPKPYSSLISKLFFMWFTPIVKLCYKQKISKEDLWDQLPELHAEKIVNELQQLWSKEEKATLKKRYLKQLSSSYISQYSRNGVIPGEETSLLQRNNADIEDEQDAGNYRTPSLKKCCIRMFGFEWLRAAVLKLMCDTSILIQPLILRLIVKETEKASDERIVWYGVLLAVLIFIAGQLDATCYHHSTQLIVTLGLKVKTALIGVVYRKVFSTVFMLYLNSLVKNFIEIISTIR